jgi:NTE family protein
MGKHQDGGVPRIGLVLGAGGVLGGAWMVGGLNALKLKLGWDPRDASHIVGTSAGSVLAAAISTGIGPERLLPMSPDWIFKGLFGSDDELVLMNEHVANGRRRLLWGMPGSWRLVVSSIRFDGNRPSLLRMLTGLIPQGLISTAPIRDTVRHLVPDGWTDHPCCWIVACDYHTGKRVAFGAPHMPVVPMADAVAASCAIPGFYRPQLVDGRLFVDGGLHSMSNLDLLADTELDLVICLNPLSSNYRTHSWDPVDRFMDGFRRMATRQLESEAAKLRNRGIEVVLLQPGEEDLMVMGNNLMEGRRSRDVVEVALQTVAQQLRHPTVRRTLGEFGLEFEPGSARKAS